MSIVKYSNDGGASVANSDGSIHLPRPRLLVSYGAISGPKMVNMTKKTSINTPARPMGFLTTSLVTSIMRAFRRCSFSARTSLRRRTFPRFDGLEFLLDISHTPP